uniref:TIGR01620 family protein n=1 Tax=Magnetococcus massalia (strain MO-1) TaxID=451514 RepID=A0A1S7LF87_MAGMO|nr:conserved membrane protein of unknown function [Candidatus Magnetococcus massalia]
MTAQSWARPVILDLTEEELDALKSTPSPSPAPTQQPAAAMEVAPSVAEPSRVAAAPQQATLSRAPSAMRGAAVNDAASAESDAAASEPQGRKTPSLDSEPSAASRVESQGNGWAGIGAASEDDANSSKPTRVVQSILQEWDNPIPGVVRGVAEKADPMALTRKVLQGAEGLAGRSKHMGRWALFASALALFFVALMVENTLLFLNEQFSYSIVIGLFFSTLLAVVFGLIAQWVYREWRLYHKQAQVDRWRQATTTMMQQTSSGGAVPLLDEITLLYKDRTGMGQGLESYQEASSSCLTDGEMVRLYSHRVMDRVDQEAYSIVMRQAATTTLMTTISPIALLDAAIFLWRNLTMIREVAVCYGFRPGWVGTVGLLSAVAQGLVGVGASELATEGSSEAMGDSVTAMVAARAGQGLLGGVFTARVGLCAMRACRPIPFDGENNPRMRNMRKELGQAVKGILKAKGGDKK